MNTIISEATTRSSLDINKAAREQLLIFIAYVFVLLLGAFLTVLLWRSGNKYQGAIKADAEARIETVKWDAATEARRIELQSREAIAKVEADSRERIAQAKSDGDTKIAETKERTAQLEKDAVALREQNLVTETRLFEANATIEAERTKRLELERSIAPRILPTLALGQDKRLKAINGVKVIFEVLPDAESARAADQLRQIVEEAGWEVVKFVPRPDINVGFFDGVIIESMHASVTNLPIVGPQEERLGAQNSRRAGELLEYLLLSYDWKVRTSWLARTDPTPPDTIKIVVGFKSSPYFDPDWVKKMEERYKEIRKRMQEDEQKPLGPP